MMGYTGLKGFTRGWARDDDRTEHMMPRAPPPAIADLNLFSFRIEIVLGIEML